MDVRRFLSAERMQEAAADWIEQHARSGGLIVARTRAVADQCVRRVGVRRVASRQGPTRGLLGMRRIGWQAHLVRLTSAVLAREERKRVGMLGVQAAVAAALHRTQSQLRHFGPIADTPGFPRALTRTLLDLRMNRVVLREDDDPVRRDLALLQRAYVEELERSRLADPPMIYALARQEMARHPASALLVVDLPDETLLERECREALMSQAGMVLGLAMDRDSEDSCEDQLIIDSQLDRARRQVFTTSAARRVHDGPDWQMFSAPNESLECVEMARRLQKVDGTRLDRCAVLLREPSRYQPLLEEALRRAGVPAYFSRGSRRPHPAGRALLALLRCAAEDFSAIRFGEYLSLGQVRRERDVAEKAMVAAVDGWLTPDGEDVPTVEEEAEPRLVPRRWESLIRKAKIVAGRERWESRLLGYEADLRRRHDEEAADWIERDIEDLKALREFALPLMALLAEHPESASWGEWSEWLDEVARTSLRAPDAVRSMLAELAPMQEVGPFALADVIRLLRPRLTNAATAPASTPFGRVFVAGLDEVRGRSFDVVFLPGLAEGIFPKPMLEDPLLLDAQRSAISTLLPQRADLVRRERHLLVHALAAASERLVISYARSDAASGRPRVPSFYAVELVRAAKGELPDLRVLEQEAASGCELSPLWPAPRHEDDAIDDFEFDLSRIQRALGSPRELVSLRYLVGANEHAARSMRAQWRLAESRWSAHDGLVATTARLTALKPLLQGFRLDERLYSVSTLERFSRCPFQFYLQGLMGMRRREDPECLEFLDAITRGNVFHAVLHEFFEAVMPRVEMNLIPADDAGAVLDEAFLLVGRAMRDELRPVNEQVWWTELEDVRLDLQGWLSAWLNDVEDWRPVATEWPFDGVMAKSGARLRGAVDLIEQNRHTEVLRVTDFKTGRCLDLAPGTANGRRLQPALYADVVAQLLKAPVEVSRLSYATQRGGYKDVAVDLRSAADSLNVIVSAMNYYIDAGQLLAAPDRNECSRCDFIKACGPNAERRAYHKSTAPLTQLHNVRSRP